MAIDNNESCGSRSMDFSSINPSPHSQKLVVYNEILRRLKDLNIDETNDPGFEDDLLSHFNKLPARYAFEVNVERAQDVLTHKRLLRSAHNSVNRPALEVRLVQVLPVLDENSVHSLLSNCPKEEDTPGALNCPARQSFHPPPAFGSSPNLEALTSGSLQIT